MYRDYELGDIRRWRRPRNRGSGPENETKKRQKEFPRRDGQRYRKLDMPPFNVEDPLGWTFRMERYFYANRLSEAEKLDLAVVGLEGRVVNWF